MKLSLVVVLVLSAVLVSHTEAGWVRRTLGRVRNSAQNVIKQKTVKAIADIIRRFGPTGGPLVRGRRAVDWSALAGRTGQALAGQLLNELELACTNYADLQDKEGLTERDLGVAFTETDDDHDGSLNNDELDLFENAIDAVQHCMDMFRQRRQSQSQEAEGEVEGV